MDDGLVAWVHEHLLKLVELFVVVPLGVVAAVLALVVLVPWRLVGSVLPVGSPPEELSAVVRWPSAALRHIVTGRGGFQWTPRL
jgi:hypothetical protein